MKQIVISLKTIFKSGNSGVIKIVLLGVALAMAIVMISKVYFENSYESFVPHKERTYRVLPLFMRSGVQMIPDWENTPGGIAPSIKSYSPLVEEATRYEVFRSDAAFYLVKDGSSDPSSIICSEMVLSDSSLFKVFPREIVGTTMSEIAATTHDVLLSRSFATAMSSNGVAESMIGELIASNSIYIEKNFTVKGIFEDFPKNSDLKNIKIVGSVELNKTFGREPHNFFMGNEIYHSYITLQPNANEEIIGEAIDTMVSQNIKREFLPDEVSIDYRLEQISEHHSSKNSVRITTIILLTLAISVLAIAMLNYVLIAVTALVKRARTIAVHRCYGASSWVIYKMLIADAVVALALSLILATFIIFALKAPIEELVKVEFANLFTYNTLWIVSTLAAVVITNCGAVPAAIYSRIPLSAAFRRFKERNRRWKHALLAVQFTGAMLFISLLSIISLQYKHLLTMDVGYNYDNLLYVQFERYSDNGYKSVKDEVSTIAGVNMVARSSYIPLLGVASNSVFNSDGYLFSSNEIGSADSDFASLFNINIVEGRDFDIENPIGREVLVSKLFVDEMCKFEDWSSGAVGKTMQLSSHNSTDEYSTVCGVFEDFMVENATSLEKRPLVIFFNETETKYKTALKYITIKVDEDTPELRKAIESKIKEVVPSQNIYVRSYSAEFEESYSDSKNLRDLILYSGLIVLIITLIGLIGYTKDEISRRRSEIAIRKIHGATTKEIIKLFLQDLNWLLLFGLMAGGIATFFAANKLLEMFAYKIPLSWWIFATSAIAITIIILFIVATTTHKAAEANPVENLKAE